MLLTKKFIYLYHFNFLQLNILKNNKKIIFSLILIEFCYDIGHFNRFNIHSNVNEKLSYIYKIRKFLKFCSDPNIKMKNFEKRRNPKISIISPIYNREKFLVRFLKNLQYQNFKDIEIIFVDDFSQDNSINVIKEFQKKDKKIFLIKNRKNKGTFVTRNIGALFSKGKYLSVPDPDDILSKDILDSCYKLAERYNYDIIRFNIVFENGKLNFNSYINSIKKGPIYQPELSNYLYYGSKKIRLCDYYIYNKIIKKEIFIKALNSIDKYCLNLYMIFFEDGLINYFIHLSGKSLYYLEQIGYLYMNNNEGVNLSKHYFYKKIRANCFFIYLKFVFEYSKNSQYYKDMINAIFFSFNKDFQYVYLLPKSNFEKESYFYKNITNTILNSAFINKSSKQILQKIKIILDKKNYIYFHKNLF